MTPRQRLLLFALFSAALAALYLYKLDATGVLSTDEPRYAAIGLEMARSGDWITPRLWGSPWYEKPALTYWMTAVGKLAGLNVDLAGRVPVALLSLAFAFFWFRTMREQFGTCAAAIATLCLSTSLAWLAYSDLCLTDLPLAACFGAAIALALPMLRQNGPPWRWIALGAAIGFAALAKGLVPLVLAVPFFWYLRRWWKQWWLAMAAFAVVALPWYILVIHRHGHDFIEVFFLRQTVSRMYSQSLQHVQPFYFYVPVLLAALFPWTPLLFTVRFRTLRENVALQFLAAVFLFGFVFFSISLNKLPGYLLPLLPPVFAVIGVAVDRRIENGINRAWLVSCAVLIALVPVIGQLIPAMLTSKIVSAQQAFIEILPITLSMLVLFVTPLIVAIAARREVAAALLVLCCIVAGLQLKAAVFPVLDQQVSPRAFWRKIQPISNEVCDAGLHRAWEYGIAFYRGSLIPYCAADSTLIHLTQHGSRPAEIVGRRQ